LDNPNDKNEFLTESILPDAPPNKVSVTEEEAGQLATVKEVINFVFQAVQGLL
jgi:hypothetical protein